MRDSTSEVAPIREAVHLCIDMQRIFAPGGLWATPWMERVLPTIASIVARHRILPRQEIPPARQRWPQERVNDEWYPDGNRYQPVH